MVTALKLKVQSDDDDFHGLTLANQIVMQIAGYVQFKMDCEYYKSKISATVFPNLYKNCIVAMP